MFGSIFSLNSISFALVFIEGVISFFSPCVVPLIPIYMSYLAGNTERVHPDGSVSFDGKKVFLHTIFFVLGISTVFFLLGMSFTALGNFFQSYRMIFTRVGGIIIILLGLFQLGIFELKFLNRERKFNLNLLVKNNANPLIAYIMGFTFSFAWTPCVGPALSSVLILASGASSSFNGYLLILLYAVGFIIPFLLMGLFTTQVLNFLNHSKNLLKYTVKIGGFILIIMGIMTYTGWMNGISGYLSSFDTPDHPVTNQSEINEEEIESSAIPAFDFALVDQYGVEHRLSDYKGKVVFLNFWATWCPPCRKEMPDIQALYHDYNENQGDVIILGVAHPKNESNPNTRELDREGIIKFLEENGYTFPVVFDESAGEVLSQYNISAFPTTFMIDPNGNIYGYAPGMLNKDMMRSIVEDTLNSTK